MLIQLHKILEVFQCYDILRTTRWGEGVICTTCDSKEVVKNGKKTPFKKNASTTNVSFAGLFLMM
jgi:hypothetical protein